MSFLRRIIGSPPAAGDGPGSRPADPAATEAEDAARNAELLAEDAERLSDELLARQLRYADRSWTPPAQGGPIRAGEEEQGEGGQS
jgi:hypothetical protein